MDKATGSCNPDDGAPQGPRRPWHERLRDALLGAHTLLVLEYVTHHVHGYVRW